MAIRDYQFLNGPTQSTVPTASTPSDDNDNISKGYADDTYTPRRDVYGEVLDLTAIKAIATADRFDDQLVWLTSAGTFYQFDAASVTAGDDDLVITPASGTGRWLKQLNAAVNGSNGSTVWFTLSGGASPMYPIDGVQRVKTASTITRISVAALNSGSSGTTTVKLYYGPALASTQTATLTATGGPSSSNATVSLAVAAGDLLAVELVEAAAGGVEDVTVGLVF